MIKKLLLITLMISAAAFPQRKKDFDISEQKLSKSLLSGFNNSQKLKNDCIEMTMLSGGYFTIGINAGDASTKFDDNCQITFGHPYAMTSYPVFSVDGQWIKADECMGSIISSGDTLKFKGFKDSVIYLEFSMILQPAGVKFIHKLRNEDQITHTLGSGIVIDPALGKWGDAALIIGEKTVASDTIVEFSNTAAEMTLWEKNNGARGIGATLSSSQKLKLIINNWRESYKNQAPELNESDIKYLYDMVLKMYFDDQTLSAGQEVINELELMLLVPDFSSDAFTRWDVPQYLDLTDNLMFPRQFDTYAEIANTKSVSANYDLNVQFSGSITTASGESHFTISGTSNFFNNIKLHSTISFEDRIVTASLKVKSNNVIIDELIRNIFIPATPVSDTGLVIVHDSLGVNAFPTVDLFFGVEQSYSGQRVLGLQKENIYLYENGNRVEDYNLTKFSSGGSALADVVFVLDISGSMGDNINQVRTYMNEFADSLKKRGYDYRIGIVTFSTTVDSVWDLTDDLEFLKAKLSQIVLWGGIEDSPSALMAASNLSFRPGSKRTIIWVTDEEYPEQNYKKQQVVDQMLLKDIVVHGVGPYFLQTEWFNPILIPTGGNFYDIYGNFRDILLDVTRMEAQDMYHVSYQSKLQSGDQKELSLKIFYAGCGVQKTYYFSSNKPDNSPSAHLKFYPNPFNPEITFMVNTANYIKGEIRIFNILGECVKTYNFENNFAPDFTWNARNDRGMTVSTGFYIVQLLMKDVNEKVYQESAKILYLK